MNDILFEEGSSENKLFTLPVLIQIHPDHERDKAIGDGCVDVSVVCHLFKDGGTILRKRMNVKELLEYGNQVTNIKDENVCKNLLLNLKINRTELTWERACWALRNGAVVTRKHWLDSEAYMDIHQDIENTQEGHISPLNLTMSHQNISFEVQLDVVDTSADDWLIVKIGKNYEY